MCIVTLYKYKRMGIMLGHQFSNKHTRISRNYKSVCLWVVGVLQLHSTFSTWEFLIFLRKPGGITQRSTSVFTNSASFGSKNSESKGPLGRILFNFKNSFWILHLYLMYFGHIHPPPFYYSSLNLISAAHMHTDVGPSTKPRQITTSYIPEEKILLIPEAISRC